MKYFFLLPLLLGSLLWSTEVSFAQSDDSPYELKWEREIPLYLGGGAFFYQAIRLEKKNKPLSIADIDLLDRKDVWRLDRSATYNWSTNSAKISDGLLYASAALPLVLLLDKKVRKDIPNYAVVASQMMLINVALTTFTKESVQRSRPYTYNPDAPLARKLQKDALRSFFSGHTSVAASSFFFVAQSFAHYHPHSKYRKYVWATGATVPALMGFLRYRAGKHFITDVVVGYIVGASIGVLVPYLHKKRF